MSSPAMEMLVRHATVNEVIALLPAMRTYVALDVMQGEAHDTFLFMRAAFIGTEGSLARLRELLTQETPVDIFLRAHETLTGLYGSPEVTAVSLILDPSGSLSD